MRSNGAAPQPERVLDRAPTWPASSGRAWRCEQHEQVDVARARRPAVASAACPASMPRPAVVPPTRRSRMPVRSTIHSSLVSRRGLEVGVGDDLVGQGGAPAGDRGIAGGVRPRHAVRSQAMGWRGMTRSPATARKPLTVPANGERTSCAGDVADARRPTSIVLALGERRGGLEHAGGRAHDQALDHEQVLAVVVTDGAAGGPARRSTSGVEVVGRGDRHGAGAVDGALGHAGEHRARAELEERRDAVAASRSSVWRQRTGLHSWASSRPAHSSASGWGRASTLATTGTSRSREVASLRAPSEAVARPAP